MRSVVAIGLFGHEIAIVIVIVIVTGHDIYTIRSEVSWKPSSPYVRLAYPFNTFYVRRRKKSCLADADSWNQGQMFSASLRKSLWSLGQLNLLAAWLRAWLKKPTYFRRHQTKTDGRIGSVSMRDWVIGMGLLPLPLLLLLLFSLSLLLLSLLLWLLLALLTVWVVIHVSGRRQSNKISA